MAEPGTFPDRYREWIARHKLIGVEDEPLVQALTERGVDEALALEEVRAVSSHPYFSAARPLGASLSRLESLLDAYSSLAALTPGYGLVEKRRGVSPDEFFERYYSANRPVVLQDLSRNWKALSLWTLDYLKETVGHVQVEIFGARNREMRLGPARDRHRRPILFGEYVAMIASGGETDDYYLEANNHAFRQEGMKRLIEDIELFPGFLDPSNTEGRIDFWLGPAGTVTPLHHDLFNVFLTQVRGRKRVRLIPSWQVHRVYPEHGVWSQVELESPDYERFPLFEKTDVYDVTIEPGETLFIPIAWWHHVRALDVSISIGTDNFVWPNVYPWVDTAVR